VPSYGPPAVYSKILFRQVVAGGAGIETYVPSGKVWVVRCCSFTEGANAGAYFTGLYEATTGVYLWAQTFAGGTAANNVVTEMYQVLNFGDGLNVFNGGSSAADYYVSGYELTAP